MHSKRGCYVPLPLPAHRQFDPVGAGVFADSLGEALDERRIVFSTPVMTNARRYALPGCQRSGTLAPYLGIQGVAGPQRSSRRRPAKPKGSP